MTKLPTQLRGELRLFAFFLGNGTLSSDVLDDFDYTAQCGDDPSALEQVFAIWSNVLELDQSGNATNAAEAAKRAAQWLRRYLDDTYVVSPPFEEWELELHGP